MPVGQGRYFYALLVIQVKLWAFTGVQPKAQKGFPRQGRGRGTPGGSLFSLGNAGRGPFAILTRLLQGHFCSRARFLQFLFRFHAGCESPPEHADEKDRQQDNRQQPDRPCNRSNINA